MNGLVGGLEPWPHLKSGPAMGMNTVIAVCPTCCDRGRHSIYLFTANYIRSVGGQEGRQLELFYAVSGVKVI